MLATLRASIKGLNLFLVWALLVSPLLAETKAKVISVKGSPKAIGDSIRVLALGDEVKVGERILTKEDEHMTLRLSSGHKIFVLASTSAKLSKLMGGKIEINQQTGSIWTKIKPLGKEESFQIRTPSSVAGVRGTAFISMVLDEKNTSICVCEGEVEVTSGGEKKLYKQGMGGTLTKGKTPPKPFSNVGKINNRRRLSRKMACMGCHWAGDGDTSRFDEESSLIFEAKP